MKMSRRVALAIFGLAFAPVAAFANTLNISGSTTVQNALIAPNKSAIEAQSQVALEVVGNGTSNGIADLLAGRSQIAMISAPLEIVVKKMEKKKPGSTAGADLTAHLVAETRVAFVVHPSNPVKSLNLAQVSGILSGKIANWSELGGPDMPIIVVAEPAGGGLRTLVESQLNDGNAVSGQVRELPNASLVPKVANQLPPAFGIAAATRAMAEGAAIVTTDEQVSQPLFLVTNGAPSADGQKVIDAARSFGS